MVRLRVPADAAKPQPEAPILAGPPKPELVAPLWHTTLVLLFLLVPWSRWLPASVKHVLSENILFRLIAILGFQWTLFAIISLGLFIRGSRPTDLIGQTWKSSADAMRDIGIAVGFMFLAIAVAVVIYLLFGSSYQHHLDFELKTSAALLVWIPVAVTAGVIEEFVCRGYLRRQVYAVTGSRDVAVIIQAAVFSFAHGYGQTAAGLVEKFAYGFFIAVLASWRRSLLPGMAAHALQDVVAGILIYLFS